jgi:excisionase family DNA binding protein
MASHPIEVRPLSIHQDRDPVELRDYVLNLTEVARILDRNPHDVTELARTGKIRARRMGRHWRFCNRDVTAYIQQLISQRSPS